MKHPIIRFLLVGIANTAIGYGSILLAHFVFGLGLVLSNVLGYLVGASFSYALNRSFTFSTTRTHLHALPRFILVASGCFLLNLLVLKIGSTFFSLPIAAAQAIAMASYTIAFYTASRFFVFRS